ncbi:Uncharacterised protein [Mycobacterium tuberculosis]|nr:Uncharacterised protein [Mycobacterium tuberculosis]
MGGQAETVCAHAVHAEREHDAPQRCLVAQRDTVDDMFPYAGGDQRWDQPRSEGPEHHRRSRNESAGDDSHWCISHFDDVGAGQHGDSRGAHRHPIGRGEIRGPQRVEQQAGDDQAADSDVQKHAY